MPNSGSFENSSFYLANILQLTILQDWLMRLNGKDSTMLIVHARVADDCTHITSSTDVPWAIRDNFTQDLDARDCPGSKQSTYSPKSVVQRNMNGPKKKECYACSPLSTRRHSLLSVTMWPTKLLNLTAANLKTVLGACWHFVFQRRHARFPQIHVTALGSFVVAYASR